MPLANFFNSNRPRHDRNIGRWAVFSWTTALVAGLCLVSHSATTAFAFQSDDANATAQDSNSESLESLEQQYSHSVEQLRSALKGIGTSKLSFNGRPSSEAELWRSKWKEAISQGKAATKVLDETSVKLLLKQTPPDDQVIDLALSVCLDDFANERYEDTLEILDRSLAFRPNEELQDFRAQVHLLVNDFDAAYARLKDRHSIVLQLPEADQELYQSIDELRKQFAREKQLRQQEAEADDLPRVEFLTSAGKIIFELYENEAPATVANFISLVENGYYNGVLFQQVKRHSVAQAGGFGIFGADGKNTIMPKGVRYQIYDEHHQENARLHFRGTLSMANKNSPNTGSSQIFISLVPQPRLNGNHTVFGRVIEGMSAAADLNVTFHQDDKGKNVPIEDVVPSIIISAKVIRKRDHEYHPEPVSQTGKPQSKISARTPTTVPKISPAQIEPNVTEASSGSLPSFSSAGSLSHILRISLESALRPSLIFFDS